MTDYAARLTNREKEMGNCKDCKFWEAHHDTRNKKWNTCNATNWVDVAKKIGDDEIAYYADAIIIKTGSMFGCVNFIANKPRTSQSA